MNLANLGKAGLLVAQNRLLTTGHNINNAATDGYSRQQVLSQTAGATSTAGGWIGRGVQAVSVQRSYNAFLSNQLNSALTKQAALSTYQDQISQINNLVADRTVGISPGIQDFFNAIQAVASNPSDIAARQELLGRSESLATQIRDANAFLDDERVNVNTQIETTVKQINSQLERINDLNTQIKAAKAANPHQPPNDLLDQRDVLVTELGELANVKVFEQDDMVNITIGNGQVLLAGGTVFKLEANPSAADPKRVAVNYTVPNGTGGYNAVEMADGSITGGHLGGLLSYRTEALDSVQNDLGRIAIGLAMSINEQHAQGYDLAQGAGTDFFNLDSPKAIANDNNSDNSALDISFTDYAKITNLDYEISFDGANYQVKTVPGGAGVSATKTTDAVTGESYLKFDGISITLPSTSPAANDSWSVQPTRDAAGTLQLKITDPAKIAAAGSDDAGNPLGASNGDNALALAELQVKKIIGGANSSATNQGSMSLNEAYSQLVNSVAVKTQANETSLKAQDTLVQQNYAAQQNVAGVNLDEEFIRLQEFQEHYRASARLIDTASTLFDTLLSLRG